MKITVVISGGLSGMRRRFELDTSNLSITERREVEALVNDMRARQHLRDDHRGRLRGADRQTYDIQVDDGERWEMQGEDGYMDDNMYRLVRLIKASAKGR